MNDLDLVIAYRIYPKVSKPTFIHEHDKLKLAQVCLSSLAQSAASLRVRMHCICDGCPAEYIEMLRATIPPSWMVSFDQTDRIGNYKTFSRQIDFLKENVRNGAIAMFAEDDYYYLPGALESFVKLLAKNKDWDYATPYRHPDTETVDYWVAEIGRLNSGHRKEYRYVPSTCLTFFVKDISQFDPQFWKMYSRRFNDTPLWAALTLEHIRLLHYLIRASFRFDKSFIKIFVQSLVLKLFRCRVAGKLVEPLTNIATHAEIKFLATGIDWYRMAHSSSALTSLDKD